MALRTPPLPAALLAGVISVSPLATGARAAEAVAIPPASAASAACTRYVSTTGSDGAPGSSTAPFRTLTEGIARARPGDVVCIRGGTYSESVAASTMPKGTPSARITLRPYPGEHVKVVGTANLRDPDYWTISGIEWTRPGVYARIVVITAGTGWVFENNDVHDSEYAGLLVGKSTVYGNPHGAVIRGNTIHDTTKVNFYFNPGRESKGMVIERNLLFNSRDTENLKAGWGGDNVCSGTNYRDFGVGEVTIRYNTFYNGGQPLTIAEAGGDARVDVYRNIIYKGTRGYALRLDSVEDCLGDNIWIHDNVAGGARKFIEDFGAKPVVKGQAVNNVFPIEPDFDSATVAGFHPRNPAVQPYGRYAPEPAAAP